MAKVGVKGLNYKYNKAEYHNKNKVLH